jgi:hypothetical protein
VTACDSAIPAGLSPTGSSAAGKSRPAPDQTSSEQIANAPIGGTDNEGSSQCVDVSWLGTKPIPDGTTIKLGSIHLERKGSSSLTRAAAASKRLVPQQTP